MGAPHLVVDVEQNTNGSLVNIFSVAKGTRLQKKVKGITSISIIRGQYDTDRVLNIFLL